MLCRVCDKILLLTAGCAYPCKTQPARAVPVGGVNGPLRQVGSARHGVGREISRRVGNCSSTVDLEVISAAAGEWRRAVCVTAITTARTMQEVTLTTKRGPSPMRCELVSRPSLATMQAPSNSIESAPRVCVVPTRRILRATSGFRLAAESGVSRFARLQTVACSGHQNTTGRSFSRWWRRMRNTVIIAERQKGNAYQFPLHLLTGITALCSYQFN